MSTDTDLSRSFLGPLLFLQVPGLPSAKDARLSVIIYKDDCHHLDLVLLGGSPFQGLLAPTCRKRAAITVRPRFNRKPRMCHL